METPKASGPAGTALSKVPEQVISAQDMQQTEQLAKVKRVLYHSNNPNNLWTLFDTTRIGP